MKRIILITGGQRSGKSSFAENKAHELTTSPVYLATARIWDEEFRKRVERHQKNRGPEWINIEEEKELSRHNVAGRVVVIDCVTLWCTNFFMEFVLGNSPPTNLISYKYESGILLGKFVEFFFDGFQ